MALLVAKQRKYKWNLVQQNDGANIILKQASRKIKKDKFSALIYGLSWPKKKKKKAHKRKGRNIKDFMFFSKSH